MEHQGHWPPPQPAIPLPLDDTRALVVAISEQYPVVGLHAEHEDTDEVYIGSITDVGADFVWLREITPNAEWEPEPNRWQLDDLTRIEFGRGYETILHAVAVEPAPKPTLS